MFCPMERDQLGRGRFSPLMRARALASPLRAMWGLFWGVLGPALAKELAPLGRSPVPFSRVCRTVAFAARTLGVIFV